MNNNNNNKVSTQNKAGEGAVPAVVEAQLARWNMKRANVAPLKRGKSALKITYIKGSFSNDRR
jgi:hypothetical protein